MMGLAHLALAIGALVAGAAPQTAVNELEELEQRIGRAWVENDREALARILTDDWTVIDVAGRVRTKVEVLDEMFGPDGSVIAQMTVDDVHVRLLGDVAVVTGRTLAVGKDGTTMRLRFTDVAVQRDGAWRVVASQGTPTAR